MEGERKNNEPARVVMTPLFDILEANKKWFEKIAKGPGRPKCYNEEPKLFYWC